MRVDTQPQGAVWSWFIGVIALGLFAWGVAELLGVGSGRGVTTAMPIAAELAPGTRGAAVIALHRLLPDATDDLGRLVSVDGTVVGDASSSGFWVRDLRDNIVFVSAERAGASDGSRFAAGDAVHVVGRIALLSPAEQADRLERARLVVPSSAMVIRDVKVLAGADGIELLRE